MSQAPNLPPEIASLSPYWQEMYLQAPPHVSRRQLSELSGHVFQASTLANKDCLGTGPAERRRFGNRIFYPREAAILWLAQESKEVPRKDPAGKTTW